MEELIINGEKLNTKQLKYEITKFVNVLENKPKLLKYKAISSKMVAELHHWYCKLIINQH